MATPSKDKDETKLEQLAKKLLNAKPNPREKVKGKGKRRERPKPKPGRSPASSE